MILKYTMSKQPQQQSLFIYLLILFLLSLSGLSACSGIDNLGISLQENSDDNTQISDGGSFSPTGNDTAPCEEDEDGNCVDSTNSTGNITLTTTNYDFGLNELEAVECETIAIPGTLSYEAEIDTDATDEVDGNYQFVFKNSGGTLTQDRIEGTESLDICYRRDEIGSHSGQIKLVLTSSSSVYAYILTLKGETSEVLFNITSPTVNQVIDSRSGHNEGVDNTEGDYLITASGSINLEMENIFAEGMDTSIIIDAEGVKYKTSFDESGNFSTTIGVPQTPGLYTVSFSLETNKGYTITKDIDIVVATTPEGSIEIRSSDGSEISDSTPSDVQSLVLGIKVKNLSISGPDASELPVEIKDIKLNGTSLDKDTSIYASGESWCQDEDGEDYSGFDVESTYCFSLEDLSEVQSGVNNFTATLENDLGSQSVSFSLVLDYNKPAITITEPTENQLYATGTTKITITGTVKNYAPLDIDESAPSAQTGDTGSYCVPSGEDDSSCPSSSIKIWINNNTLTSPIYVFPVPTNSSYEDGNLQDIHEGISGEQCQTYEEEETILDAKSGDTSYEDGQIVTTVTTTDEDGNETTTTYTTAEDGSITISTSDSEESEFSPVEDDDTYSTSITTDEDGNISSTEDNASTDVQVSYTTDKETGEIIKTTTQTVCNIPEGTFSITIDPADFEDIGAINLYANVLEVQAESLSGHRTIATKTFFTGETNLQQTSRKFTNRSTSKMGTVDLKAGTLGSVDQDCNIYQEDSCIKRSPLMLYVSNGTFSRNSEQGKRLIQVVQKILNDNLKFTDMANGTMPEDEDGKIDAFYNFRTQYQSEENATFTWFEELPDEYREKFILQALHSPSMGMKAMSLGLYRQYAVKKGYCSSDLDKLNLCFFERDFVGNYGLGDDFDYNTAYKEEFNVSRDSCQQTITTAFVPLKDLSPIGMAMNGSDFLAPVMPEWPRIAGQDVNFDDFVEGKWYVDTIEIKNDKINADICLLPDDPNLYDEYEKNGCDADVSSASVPAFWGHFIGYNLIKGGLLGIEGVDDETMPMIWNLGKVRLKLYDIISLKRKEVNGSWTNYVDMSFSDEPDLNVIDLDYNAANNSVILEPFENCREYYQSEWTKYKDQYGFDGPNTLSEEDYPLGCNNVTDDQTNVLANYPFLLEVNSYKGAEIATFIQQNDSPGFLLATVWQGVVDTFQKIVGCMDTEIINPMLNTKAFPYGFWVNPEDQIETSFEFSEFIDGLDDINLSINLNQSDIIVAENGLTLRLSTQAGVDDVSMFKLLSGNILRKSNSANQNLANQSGHLIRTSSQNNLDQYPLISSDPDNEVFAGISINIEEMVNATSYLLFKKGPFSLLDVFEIDEITPNNDYSIGFDKVVFANFDICDDIAGGALKTDLPPGILFTPIQGQFDSSALHLDLELSHKYPATIAMDPLKDDSGDIIENGIDLKLGLTNVQVAVKELIDNGDNTYTIGEEEKIRIRLDGVLSIKMIYFPDSYKFHLFIEPFENQNLHLSVVPGGGGNSYDDVNVITELHSLFGTVFRKFAKSVTTDSTSSDVTAIIELKKNNTDGRMSIKDILDAEVTFNMDAASNGSCDGQEKPAYASDSSSNTSRMTQSKRKTKNSRLNLSSAFGNKTKSKSSKSTVNKGSISKTKITKDFNIGSLDIESLDIMSHCFKGNYINSEDNPLEEALCESGIEELTIDPTIEFDYTNGYIHASTDLMIYVYDWLYDEIL